MDGVHGSVHAHCVGVTVLRGYQLCCQVITRFTITMFSLIGLSSGHAAERSVSDTQLGRFTEKGTEAKDGMYKIHP